MEAVELLKRRRSCRKFETRQVSEADLGEILACGLNAPSGGNKQDTRIVVVRDGETVKALSRLNAAVMGSDKDPFYGAPMVCLIFAPQDNPNHDRDGALVLGAMQDGAYAIGVGSCWINRCDGMFRLPEGLPYLEKWGLQGFVGVGCCILGYPAEELPPKEVKEGRVIFD